MKTLLELMNENLGKNYKDTADYLEDMHKKNVNLEEVGRTIAQYMVYQDVVKNADMSKFRVKEILENANNVHNGTNKTAN